MKFTDTEAITGEMILANTHYVARPYDLTDYSDLVDENGMIAAGTILPSNDSSALGVLFSDVRYDENPNGTLVTHGTIVTGRLPEEPTDDAKSALTQITFI